ncbi:MAG: hypothetical protein GY786_15645 [Proteobacteria bacterium]|nr:hypothetical protein [Pseudomonadota bacterium]
MSVVENSIIKSIEKNGFPEKMVSLPFRAIFDSCKKHGLKLAEVLNALKEKEVFSDIGEEKILFYREKPDVELKGDGNSETGNPFGLPPEFMKTAMDQMKNMNPEQLKELKEKVMNMSSQDRSEMLNKAKTMFKSDKNKE